MSVDVLLAPRLTSEVGRESAAMGGCYTRAVEPADRSAAADPEPRASVRASATLPFADGRKASVSSPSGTAGVAQVAEAMPSCPSARSGRLPARLILLTQRMPVLVGAAVMMAPRGDGAVGKLNDVCRAIGMLRVPGARIENELATAVPWSRPHDGHLALPEPLIEIKVASGSTVFNLGVGRLGYHRGQPLQRLDRDECHPIRRFENLSHPMGPSVPGNGFTPIPTEINGTVDCPTKRGMKTETFTLKLRAGR